MASGNWGTKIGMTVNLLPDVKFNEEARNQKALRITNLVCKLQTKIQKFMNYGNITSRHAKVMKLCRIINRHQKISDDIFKISHITEQSVKCREKLVCEIQNSPKNAN